MIKEYQGDRETFERIFRDPPYEFSFEKYGKNDPWPGMYRCFTEQCAWEGYQLAMDQVRSSLTPAGSIHAGHLVKTNEPWCKEVLLYSPNNQGDTPEYRVQLFTSPIFNAKEIE